VIKIKKPNKAMDMVVIFPLKKSMKQEDYKRMSDKICELFPDLSVVWYVIPEKQMDNIQKMLEKKFKFELSEKEINILMEKLASKIAKNLKKKGK
jgi:tRNA C32,U32 (ribose-2'-O)-methylase TrmJ